MTAAQIPEGATPLKYNDRVIGHAFTDVEQNTLTAYITDPDAIAETTGRGSAYRLDPETGWLKFIGSLGRETDGGTDA